MFTVIEGNSKEVPDVEWFVDQLGVLPGYFDHGQDIFVARAPGRLDVMGGIADYSGSLVLEMPIAEAIFAAVQTNSSNTIKIASIRHDCDRTIDFEMPIESLIADERPLDLAAAKDYFTGRDGGDWASYVAGVFFVLGRELGIRFEIGARILVVSRVPIGKGVSSSAALELSVMQAVCSAYSIDLTPRDLALLCQKVENHVVGAACGVMDQITSHCGEEGKLTALVCQPAEILGSFDVPENVELWGIDSGVRHAVSGSDYSSVRIGAFMGYRLIAELAGLPARPIDAKYVVIDDPRWNGYLANITAEEYEREFRNRMPESMRGDEFLRAYQGTTDRVTSVDPAKSYAIKAPSEHAIYENRRVRRFAELMTGSPGDRALSEAGELMFQSHASYGACGLTEARTDRIVEMVRSKRNEGLFGARITGGGSGGTVVVLARHGSRNVISQIESRFEEETGHRPFIFHGSSIGCDSFGYLRLRRE